MEDPPIDLEIDVPLLEEFMRELESAIALENAHDIISDRVSVKLCILQTEYYLGKLTMEELLAKIEECSRPCEEYDSHERFSALLETKVTYLTYLCLSDNIGRPYGPGKTLEDLIAEFDRDKEVRYSGYISKLLHVDEIQRKINYVIYDRRKEIYCDIYMRKECR